MCSATWDGPVGKIAASFTKNPERVSIKVESAHIEEKVYYCDDFDHKNRLLDKIVCQQDMEQIIIFAATKRSTEKLAKQLQEAGHKASFLHGDLPQSKRNRIVQDLRNGKVKILVATDVAARLRYPRSDPTLLTMIFHVRLKITSIVSVVVVVLVVLVSLSAYVAWMIVHS